MKKSNAEKLSFSRPIVLIGMMGAGKTSVGRILAELLGMSFLDADTEIEAAANCKVAQIFADYGEEEFRRMERQVIERLLKEKRCVLSLGGGAFMNPLTRQRIKESAFSVWLKVDKQILLTRVMRHGDRPLLKGGNAEEKLNKLLSEREPIYKEADLTVLCDDKPVAQTAKRVLEALQQKDIGIS